LSFSLHVRKVRAQPLRNVSTTLLLAFTRDATEKPFMHGKMVNKLTVYIVAEAFLEALLDDLHLECWLSHCCLVWV